MFYFIFFKYILLYYHYYYILLHYIILYYVVVVVIIIIIRDVTKVKNIQIRRMRIITSLFVEYRMGIANTKYQY